MPSRSAGIFLTLTALGCLTQGCGVVDAPASCETGSTCDCPSERFVEASGACCPAWSRAQNGSCQARPWVVPPKAAGLGPEGASGATVGMGADGLAVVSYAHTRPFDPPQIMVAEEVDEGAFSLREPGAALAGGASLPTAVVDAHSRHAVVTWTQGLESKNGIYVSERGSDGVWQDPRGTVDNFSSNEQYALRSDVVIGGSGEAILVWDQWTGQNFGIQIARQKGEGEMWQLPKSYEDIYSPKVFYSNLPFVATNASGDAVVSWFQSNGGPLMTWVSERRTPNDDFTHVRQEDFISPPAQPVDYVHARFNPRPAVSPDGHVVVTWAQLDGSGNVPLFLATREPDGTWTLPQSLGNTFSPPEGISRCAVPVFGPNGDLYVTWMHDPGTGYQVLFAHRASSGEWLISGQSPMLLSAPGVFAFEPHLAVGPSGAVVVAWSEDVGGAFRIAARRFDGKSAWDEATVLSPDGAGDALDPAVSIGKNDRALVVWTQGPFQKEHLYVARVE